MWVLPTYGRPGRCQDALDSIMAAGVATPGVVVVDGDPDPAYRALRLPTGWRMQVHARNGGLSAALNGMAFELFPGLAWYGALSDDFIVRSADWDTKLVAAAGAWGIAHSNDGWQSETRIAGATIFGGELIRALGWWALRCTWHAFSDDAWEAIAHALGGRHYCADVMVEHHHAESGKGPADATYRHSYSRLQQDRAAYDRFAREELPATIARLRQLMPTETC